MFIRTVLGDIPPEQFGVCYAHEHVIIDDSFATRQFPEFKIDSVENAVAELAAFHIAGGQAMIDTMPCNCGRNVRKLVEVSRRSSVHIVCPTGLHLQKYYPPDHWSQRSSDDDLAELFVSEIKLGIDANDCAGPDIQRTSHRAGVIKVAGSRDTLSEHERKSFRAAARAHTTTGCPIITHTEEGTAGLEQLEVLAASGADLRHVVLSHTDRKPDLAYHRALLKTGAYLEYDSAFRWKPGQENFTLTLLRELLPEFPDQLMLGMDAARRSYWRSYGGSPGLTFLLTEFSAVLRQAGISAPLLKKVFVDNPARCYQFGSRC